MTRLQAIIIAASLLCAPFAHGQTSTEPVDVTLLAINDFHGNLRPAPGGKGTELAARLRDRGSSGALTRLSGRDPQAVADSLAQRLIGRG